MVAQPAPAEGQGREPELRAREQVGEHIGVGIEMDPDGAWNQAWRHAEDDASGQGDAAVHHKQRAQSRVVSMLGMYAYHCRD
jgi:hypothetical protein